MPAGFGGRGYRLTHRARSDPVPQTVGLQVAARKHTRPTRLRKLLLEAGGRWLEAAGQRLRGKLAMLAARRVTAPFRFVRFSHYTVLGVRAPGAA